MPFSPILQDVFTEKQLKEGAVILHVLCSVYVFLGTAIDVFTEKQLKEGAVILHVLCSVYMFLGTAIDVFTEKQLKEGAVILHVLCSVYMFLGTAIVCEDYFMPSLLILADYLHLNPSVAGATLIAFGMSMPELVTSAVGVFVSKNDIGVGVMAGTAVANYTLIIGCCCLMKRKDQQVYLKAWPLTRDTVWYIFSLGVLIFIIFNGRIDWGESACLLVVYALYIFSMYFDNTLQSRFDQLVLRRDPDTGRTRCCCFPMIGEGDGAGEQAGEKLWDEKDGDGEEDQEDEEEDAESVLAVPESAGSRVLWVLCLPLILPMFLTVPDCRRKRWRKWFPLTFFMSMVWSTAFSYVLIWMVTVIGFAMGASDTLMGITLLGAGTSVPDLVACVVATWAGEGDMAISATIGAITFDILVCLGLPWFIKTVFMDNFGVVFVQTAGLSLTLSSIFITIVFVFIGICLSRWQFHRAFGVACLIVYVAFIIFAVFTEEMFIGTVAVFRDCENPPL
ncbi:sodium/potassium/calcium exchanger 5-like [Branchiostoma lanceolatum]|uniref:sodium/potassium/calcium exchanger 5-like n=1 Tax=Branchiostoma lanceolatum TaxID=7740 RepID=UPI0034551D57